MKIVPDVIERQVLLTVKPGDNARVSAKLMVARGVSSLLVVGDDGRLVGIATERDFTRCFADDALDLDALSIADIMTTDPDTVTADDPARSALDLMELRGYRHLPVTDDAGRPIGVVSIRDLYAVVMEATRNVLSVTQTYVFGDRYNPDA